VRRKLSTLFAAVSLLLFVAATVLLVRSGWRDDGVTYGDPRGARTMGLAGHRGNLIFYTFGFAPASDFSGILQPGLKFESEPSRGDRWIISFPATGGGVDWHVAGFRYASRSGPYFGVTVYTRLVEIPLWFICLLTLPAPFLWLRRRRREWRLRRDPYLCANCGYNLRGTPDRCPECGTTPAQGQAAAGVRVVAAKVRNAAPASNVAGDAGDRQSPA
jgi:hypothetical protein